MHRSRQRKARTEVVHISRDLVFPRGISGTRANASTMVAGVVPGPCRNLGRSHRQDIWWPSQDRDLVSAPGGCLTISFDPERFRPKVLGDYKESMPAPCV